MITPIGKSRLNRHRCERCGHPMREGQKCKSPLSEGLECGANVAVSQVHTVNRSLKVLRQGFSLCPSGNAAHLDAHARAIAAIMKA
jgi:hypothetical protein